MVEDSKQWLSLHDRNFVDRYKRNEIEIVLSCSIGNLCGTDADYFHLILSSVPLLGNWYLKRATKSPSETVSPPHDVAWG